MATNFANDCYTKAECLGAGSKISKLYDKATCSYVNSTDTVLTHFVAFVCVGDKLYELDGREEGPIYHGPKTQASLLKDSTAVIKTFMARDPTERRVTITAMAVLLLNEGCKISTKYSKLELVRDEKPQQEQSPCRR